MGLFGSKKATPETTEVAVKTAPQAAARPLDRASVLVKPRITEKAALLLDRNVYTFEIVKGASKYDVRDAVKALYNVTPERVRIVNKQPRHSLSKLRGRTVMEHGLRKAYVYLKKGDRIDLA